MEGFKGLPLRFKHKYVLLNNAIICHGLDWIELALNFDQGKDNLTFLRTRKK